MPVTFEAKGLMETQHNLEAAADALHGVPITNAMRRAALLVERDAKKGAPVDTGRLRNSISSEVRVAGAGGGMPGVFGVVGTNVKYAAAMEVGAKPHWVPPGALDTWARRHGLNPFLVARAISKKGVKGRHYLQNAFDKNKPMIITIIGAAVTGVVEKANKG